MRISRKILRSNASSPKKSGLSLLMIIRIFFFLVIFGYFLLMFVYFQVHFQLVFQLQNDRVQIEISKNTHPLASKDSTTQKLQKDQVQEKISKNTHPLASKDSTAQKLQKDRVQEKISDSTAQKIDRKLRSCEQKDNFDAKDMSSKKYPIFYPPPLPTELREEASTSSAKYCVAPVPRYGQHRSNKDAVMTFAHGYQLPQLINFVMSLWETDYNGDLVIGVGTNLTEETRTFLEESAQNRPGLVVYEISLPCQRKNSCKSANIIEQEDSNGSDGWVPLSDTRPYRRVSVVRYEYYWAWAKRYNSKSLIFLTDARDVFFQRNPFQVYRHQTKRSGKAGTLVFFQEAIKISESKANSRWIEKMYSSELKDELAEKMVVCSGTTFGSQAAVEVYARAMVYEFDKTKCKHCANKNDQGFHNFLIHKNRLDGANRGGISKVLVHAQGQGGIVNVVGMVSKANDGKSLHDLGLVNADTQEILENDHKTVSAVVQMNDRDKRLKDWVDSQVEKRLSLYRSCGSDYLIQTDDFKHEEAMTIGDC